jgi:hypothetical protein
MCQLLKVKINLIFDPSEAKDNQYQSVVPFDCEPINGQLWLATRWTIITNGYTFQHYNSNKAQREFVNPTQSTLMWSLGSAGNQEI